MKKSIEKPANDSLRPFVHLHTHTEYSELDGMTKIAEMVDKAIADGMPGIAITDHANMYGAKEFVDYVSAKNKELGTSFKPIIGCELYVARRGMAQKSVRDDYAGYHLILLAKNYEGYCNLVKIVSKSWSEGFFVRPRTDLAFLERHSEGLICCSACIGSEVAQHIIHYNMAEAERAVERYKQIFGDDFYLELHRHKPTSEEANQEIFHLEQRVNKALLDLASKHNLKVVCANDVHFLNEEDAEAHDAMLCANTSRKKSERDRLIFSQQEWLKSTAEMNELFADIPEAIDSTIEIFNKVEEYSIECAPSLPKPALGDDVADEMEHLAKLAFEGAKHRYGEELPQCVVQRLKSELLVIKEKRCARYFLLWNEIITYARKELDAWVGPGRGWAAGSIVLYCLGITQIDPFQFGLAGEQFLKADLPVLPNIDVDFDDYSRDRVVEWMRQRYGEQRVINIATPRRTSPAMAQRQVASVYDTPLAKLSEREQQIAQRLEGVVREMGIHACGIAVCGEDISQRVPVACVNHYYHTERVAVTQYTGAQLESVGVVKFNILSAKHLSIMRRAVGRLERERGIRIDVDALPYDDKATLQLYRRAETIATFQFDSDIMRQMLIDRKVATFKDLVEIYTIHCNNGVHAVAYSRLAYQTAYLKAHYPLEYMEAALYYNRYNRECVDLYREECRRLGVLDAFFGDEEQ